MSHRKFEAPRHGSLGFLPKKRARKAGNRGRMKSYPKDQKTETPYLTSFIGYKVGSTHIVREANKPGSLIHKKEIVEAVTVLETPPMIVIGLTAYYQSPYGLKSLGTIWAHHVSEEARRRWYKRWSESKKLAFTRHRSTYTTKTQRNKRRKTLAKFAKHASVVRVIAHTQMSKIKISQKKAHVSEIQVNGGDDIAAKLKFAYRLLEKFVPVSDVFNKDDMIDLVGITKGHGYKGVVSRWGVARLARKTHKGLRKVACIGAWHPSRVSYSVARAGQKGFFHRCLNNIKVYMVGKSLSTEEGKTAGTTKYDITKKSINPISGWPRYGFITEDFLMLKGHVTGPPRRVLTLRKGCLPTATSSRAAKEEIELKFVDTASKLGTGHFQTKDEKKRFMGPMKKELNAKKLKDLEKARAEKKAAEESAN